MAFCIAEAVPSSSIARVRVANGSGPAIVVGDVVFGDILGFPFMLRKLCGAHTRTCICSHTGTSQFDENWRGHTRIRTELTYSERSRLSDVVVTKILLQFSYPPWLCVTLQRRTRADDQANPVLHPSPKSSINSSKNCKNNTMWLSGWNKSIVALTRR